MMVWVEYKSGVVAPDGYEERLCAYVCDVPVCREEAVVPWSSGDTYSGLCEDHITEAQEADRIEQTEPEVSDERE